jgi:hypothetical protein
LSAGAPTQPGLGSQAKPVLQIKNLKIIGRIIHT